MIALALRSGIPPREWRAADPRDLATALDLYRDEDEQAGGRRPGRVVMSSDD